MKQIFFPIALIFLLSFSLRLSAQEPEVKIPPVNFVETKVVAAQQPQAGLTGLKLRASFDIDKEFSGGPQWLYLPKSQNILVFSKDKTTVIDVLTGQMLSKLPPLKSTIKNSSISLNPDETQFVMHSGKAAELWDVADLKLIRKLPDADKRIDEVRWSHDGTKFILAVNSWDLTRTHIVFNAATGASVFIIKTKYKSWAEFSSSEPLILTGEVSISYRRKDLVKVWSSETGDLRRDLGINSQFRSNSVNAMFSPNGRNVIIYDRSSPSIKVFDPETGEILWNVDLGKDGDLDGKINFSPDGKRMLVGIWKFRGILKEEATWFRIYDTQKFEFVGELKTNRSGKHQVESHQIVWRPDSRLLISSGERYKDDYEAEAWSLDTFEEQYDLTSLIAKNSRALFEGGYKYYDRIEFTADSRFLVTSNRGKNNSLRIWDAETGKLLKSFDRIDGFTRLTSDNRYLLRTQNDNNTVSIYEIDL